MTACNSQLNISAVLVPINEKCIGFLTGFTKWAPCHKCNAFFIYRNENCWKIQK